MKRKQAIIDMVMAVGFVALSAYVFTTAMAFGRGADVFPKFIAGAITVLAVILFLDAVRLYRAAGLEPAADSVPAETEKQAAPVWDRIRPYVVFGAIAAYVGLMPIVGFFVTSALFMVGVMMILGVRSLRLYLYTVVGLIVGIYALFVMQLNVPVPTGFLI